MSVVPGRVYVVSNEEKLITDGIRKGPPCAQGPLAFATAGTTTQVRATQYWRPSTAYW